MKRFLRDLSAGELLGVRALVRVDYNVPLDDGEVQDASRVEASYPTLRHLVERDARPVLMSHLGRPGGRPDPGLSLRPVVPILESGLGVRVRFEDRPGEAGAVERSRALAGGEVLLLENTRFHPGEKADDDAFAEKLSALGDLFVNDAFGSLHRAHASTVGVTRHLRPAVGGFLVEAELRALGSLLEDPSDPFVIAFGGAKISDKIDLLRRFAERADVLLVGGAMANTFLRARGEETGRSLVEEEALEAAREVADRAGERLRLPTDLVVAPDPDAGGEARTVAAGGIPGDAMALDIGEETRAAFAAAVRDARTFFWNGPMGLFEREPFDAGTVAVARAAAEATDAGAFTVVGGGDSASAIRRAGVEDRVSHVSTGGGAALQYLASGSLAGLDALDDAPEEAGGEGSAPVSAAATGLEGLEADGG